MQECKTTIRAIIGDFLLMVAFLWALCQQYGNDIVSFMKMETNSFPADDNFFREKT